MVGKFLRIKKVKKNRTVKTLLVFLVDCGGIIGFDSFGKERQ